MPRGAACPGVGRRGRKLWGAGPPARRQRARLPQGVGCLGVREPWRTARRQGAARRRARRAALGLTDGLAAYSEAFPWGRAKAGRQGGEISRRLCPSKAKPPALGRGVPAPRRGGQGEGRPGPLARAEGQGAGRCGQPGRPGKALGPRTARVHALRGGAGGAGRSRRFALRPGLGQGAGQGCRALGLKNLACSAWGGLAFSLPCAKL